MKLLLVSVCMCVLNVNCSSNNDKITTRYIEFNYTGPQDKPIPTIVFYLANSFDTTSVNFGKAVLVSSKEMIKIEHIIFTHLQSEKSGDSFYNQRLLKSLYQCTVHYQNDTVNYSGFINEFNEVFNTIIGALDNSKQKQEVEELWSSVYSRISW